MVHGKEGNTGGIPRTHDTERFTPWQCQAEQRARTFLQRHGILGPAIEHVLYETRATQGLVVAHFDVTSVPEGGMSKEIRREWVGVSLPVRERAIGAEAGRYIDLITMELREPVRDSKVQVFGLDGVSALDAAGRHEAADAFASFVGFPLLFNENEGVVTHH